MASGRRGGARRRLAHERRGRRVRLANATAPQAGEDGTRQQGEDAETEESENGQCPGPLARLLLPVVAIRPRLVVPGVEGARTLVQHRGRVGFRPQPAPRRWPPESLPGDLPGCRSGGHGAAGAASQSSRSRVRSGRGAGAGARRPQPTRRDDRSAARRWMALTAPWSRSGPARSARRCPSPRRRPSRADTGRRQSDVRGFGPGARRDPCRADAPERRSESPIRTACRTRRAAWNDGMSGSGSRPVWGSP